MHGLISRKKRLTPVVRGRVLVTDVTEDEVFLGEALRVSVCFRILDRRVAEVARSKS